MFYSHMQNGDYDLAATTLYINMETLVRFASDLELCAALCATANDPLYDYVQQLASCFRAGASAQRRQQLSPARSGVALRPRSSN